MLKLKFPVERIERATHPVNRDVIAIRLVQQTIVFVFVFLYLCLYCKCNCIEPATQTVNGEVIAIGSVQEASRQKSATDK